MEEERTVRDLLDHPRGRQLSEVGHTPGGEREKIPEVQEGMFIPVTLDAKYVINSFEHESFFGSYRMVGRFYQDELLSTRPQQASRSPDAEIMQTHCPST